MTTEHEKTNETVEGTDDAAPEPQLKFHKVSITRSIRSGLRTGFSSASVINNSTIPTPRPDHSTLCG